VKNNKEDDQTEYHCLLPRIKADLTGIIKALEEKKNGDNVSEQFFEAVVAGRKERRSINEKLVTGHTSGGFFAGRGHNAALLKKRERNPARKKKRGRGANQTPSSKENENSSSFWETKVQKKRGPARNPLKTAINTQGFGFRGEGKRQDDTN